MGLGDHRGSGHPGAAQISVATAPNTKRVSTSRDREPPQGRPSNIDVSDRAVVWVRSDLSLKFEHWMNRKPHG
jgi:hypothetical protein